MEVEYRQQKEHEEYEVARQDRVLECAVKTQKKANKRKIKNERKKMLKQYGKQGRELLGVEEGMLVDRVWEKYGEEALVKKSEELEEVKGSSSEEEEEDLLGKGP